MHKKYCKNMIHKYCIVYKGLKFVSEQKNAFMADGNLRLTVPKARNILMLKVRKIEF